MRSEAQKEHGWLQTLTGDWTYESEAMMKPGEPPVRTTGTESVRSIGGLWIVAEAEFQMPSGGAGTSIMTLGYDPRKQRFTGTWLGSMMTHMWVYEGSLDAAEKVLTLDTEGPDMSGQARMAKYRDIIELRTEDERVLRSEVLAENGDWSHLLTATYRRKR